MQPALKSLVAVNSADNIALSTDDFVDGGNAGNMFLLACGEHIGRSVERITEGTTVDEGHWIAKLNGKCFDDEKVTAFEGSPEGTMLLFVSSSF